MMIIFNSLIFLRVRLVSFVDLHVVCYAHCFIRSLLTTCSVGANVTLLQVIAASRKCFKKKILSMKLAKTHTTYR